MQVYAKCTMLVALHLLIRAGTHGAATYYACFTFMRLHIIATLAHFLDFEIAKGNFMFA